MQKKSALFLAASIVLLLSVMLVPMVQAAGTVVKVIVQNKTGQVVNIHLNGDLDYTLSIPPGVSVIWINPGNYNFSTDSQCTGMNGRVNISRGASWIFKCKEGEGEVIFKQFVPVYFETPIPGVTSCAAGQVFDGNTCIPVVPTCGEGEVLEGNECIPVEPTCEEGEVLEGNECIPVNFCPEFTVRSVQSVVNPCLPQ
jgi:hypothetical protein